MMSGPALRAMNTEIAKEAAKNKRQPYILWENEIDLFPPFPFPNLGYYVPEGWERAPDELGTAQEACRCELRNTQVWWVDKTGFGLPTEPAMTIDQFLKSLKQYHKKHPDHGYAVVEEGPFQVYVGAFRRVCDD